MTKQIWSKSSLNNLQTLYKSGASMRSISKIMNISYDIITRKLNYLIEVGTFTSGDRPSFKHNSFKIENPDLEIIARVVSKEYDLNEDFFCSKTRLRTYVLPRQIAHKISKMITKYSLGTIGKNIGPRNHATVLHSIKTINNLIETEPGFDLRFNNLLEKCEDALIIANSIKLVENEHLKSLKNVKKSINGIHNKIEFNLLIRNILNGQK